MIRQAELADFREITQVRDSVTLDMDRLRDDVDYRVQVQQDGFLLPTGIDFDHFQADLPNYGVAENEGEVAGYCHLSYCQGMSPAEVSWLKPELKDVYWSVTEHAELDGIGVSPQAKRGGIASEILQAAEGRVRARNIPWLFSFVVLTPVTNFASMMFHEKNGFNRVAVLHPTIYEDANGFQLDGFQSFLYGKQVS
jgi:ribosomal protein S18 acetylase RimI-like enzyme